MRTSIFFEANPRAVLVANRGALAGDPLLEGIISEELRVIRQRMLDALGLTGHEPGGASIALYDWLAFVRAVCVEWLADRTFFTRRASRPVSAHVAERPWHLDRHKRLIAR